MIPIELSRSSSERKPPPMKTIFIIGGFGHRTTNKFREQLFSASRRLIPQFENQGIPLIIEVDFNHQPMRLDDKGNIAMPFGPDPNVINLVKEHAREADIITASANTIFVPTYIEILEREIGKKLVYMPRLAIEKAWERNAKKVGVLAIGHTFRSGLYQNLLEGAGIYWLGIPDDFAKKLDRAVFAVMEKDDEGEENRVIAREAVEYLRGQGTDAIIFGCSELSILLEKEMRDEEYRKDIIDPVELLADEVVRQSIATSQSS